MQIPHKIIFLKIFQKYRKRFISLFNCFQVWMSDAQNINFYLFCYFLHVNKNARHWKLNIKQIISSREGGFNKRQFVNVSDTES